MVSLLPAVLSGSKALLRAGVWIAFTPFVADGSHLPAEGEARGVKSASRQWGITRGHGKRARTQAPRGDLASDDFLADLEYPVRGRKGTRRLGPTVSRRLFALFHPNTPPEHVLV